MAVTLVISSIANAQYGITDQEVRATQEKWGAGIVRIGDVFLSKGDYKQEALDHIMDLYDYELGSVAFKPTLVSKIPFRSTIEGALSYFVGGNSNFPEDKGFAIAPYTNVRFENHKIFTYGMKAFAMGHYYFTKLDGEEIKVEYTLGFFKRGSDIKITLQDSSVPYNP